MIRISPEVELLRTVMMDLNKLTGVKVFETALSDETTYPQIDVSINSNRYNQRSKNEQQVSYTISVDYYDLTKGGNHSEMIDNCYLIREYIQRLKLDRYIINNVSFNSRNMTDTSTSKTLFRTNILADINIQEKAII